MLASELNILFFINISVDSCLQQNTTSKTVLSPKNYITSIHFLIHIFISIYTHTYKTPVLFPWSQEMVPCFFSSIYHSWNFNYCYLVVDITIITSPDLSFTFLGTHCYFPLYKIFFWAWHRYILSHVGQRRFFLFFKANGHQISQINFQNHYCIQHLVCTARRLCKL